MKQKLTRAVVASLLALLLLAAPAAASGPWIGVKGKHLVNGAGKPIRLIGVNRSGTEFRCQEGKAIFDGPTDAKAIAAMKSWDINAVRVPLNETCWLGINGIQPQFGGAAYRRAIHAFVDRLERAGLYVILDLHEVAPGDQQAFGIPPMVDRDHGADLWRSVATSFRGDRSLLFDLYNEPHSIDWSCWEHGCTVSDEQVGSYETAGMTELVAAVRSTGARQPLMLGGINWSGDLGEWLQHLPPDPAHAEVASNHSYDYGPCNADCKEAILRVSRRHPVVTGELGDTDCNYDYVLPYMRWADRHGISYLPWTWNAKSFWGCRVGPSLISNYQGKPTGYGIGVREHLREVDVEGSG